MEKILKNYVTGQTVQATYFRLALFRKDNILFNVFTEDVRCHSLSKKNHDFYTRIYGYSI